MSKSTTTVSSTGDKWLPLVPTWGRPVAEQVPTAPLPAQTGKFFHRDLSWLQFNDRVLSEASDESVPPLERLRFAGIVSSNLDEFFMIRVAGIARRARRAPSRNSSRLSAPRILAQIRNHVLAQKARQASVLRDILTALVREGIVIYTDFTLERDLDRDIKSRLPKLKFIRRRWGEGLPGLTSEFIHVFVRFPDEFAIISLESRQARLLQLPSSGNTKRYVLLERWLTARAPELFPDKEVIEAFPFKILRDADLRYHPDDEISVEEQVIEGVQRRSKARIVRLEVDAPAYSEGALFIATALGLSSAALYRFDLPLDLRTLARISNIKGFRQLRYPPVRPKIPPLVINRQDIFKSVQRRDVLLHHPYDSFDVIVRFLQQAARDPQVTRIYHTLYRTSQESPIMEALKEAVRRKKKVVAYVEIKARFDELNNLRWATELRKAGVRVVQTIAGFKVHSKLTQVFRRENGREISYVHLGTGNYHPDTAKQYTDLGLLTADETLGAEVEAFFSAIRRRRRPGGLNELFVAPGNLHKNFLRLIREEARIQRSGGKGHIIAKMNSLVDKDIIEALYDASRDGVRIDLIVRGICCLKPGVPGLSENITVTSVIDRFLEHSRIYYFRADGARKLYLSSADWMPRNFYSRFELAFPVKDPALRKFIRDVILSRSLGDNVKAWSLKSDGLYWRVPTPVTGRVVRSQAEFELLAKNGYRGTVLVDRPPR